MKKLKNIFITILFYCFFCFNLYAGGAFGVYSVDEEEEGGDIEYYKEILIDDGDLIEPKLVNISTLNYFDINFAGVYGYYTYDFFWTNETDQKPQSVYWICTFQDAQNEDNLYSITTVKPVDSIKRYVHGFHNPIVKVDYYGIGISVSTTKELTLKKGGFVEFVSKIKENVEIFEKIDSSIYGANKGFIFGAGFLEELGFKNSSEYGINPDKPMYYVFSWNKTNYDWDFCYCELGDDEILGELTCHSSYTSISDKIQPNSLTIFPNPTSDFTTISLDLLETGNIKIELCDLFGRTVLDIFDGFYEETHFEKTISTSNLAKGIYYLKLQIGKDYKVEKVVVN